MFKKFNLISYIKSSDTLAKLQTFLNKRFSTPIKKYCSRCTSPSPQSASPFGFTRSHNITPSLYGSGQKITAHSKAMSVIPGIKF